MTEHAHTTPEWADRFNLPEHHHLAYAQCLLWCVLAGVGALYVLHALVTGGPRRALHSLEKKVRL